MHKYLRAIGFSELKTRKDFEQLIEYIITNADSKTYVEKDSSYVLTEYRKFFGDNMGIIVNGEYDADNKFYFNYAFPYLYGDGITSEEDITIERHAEKESYAGVCDDIKVGVILIFYLQNCISYMRAEKAGLLPLKGTTLTLSALSCEGMIMMPIVKNENDKERIKEVSNNRNKLIAAARNGDEEAIESLTLEDMDTYTVISRKIHKEDVFSLVDSYFMPYGVESDKYSILGEILECKSVTNIYTMEEVYQLTIDCNELIFNICINKKDLLGEPMTGRRFKGNIWLQGMVNFPEFSPN